MASCTIEFTILSVAESGEERRSKISVRFSLRGSHVFSKTSSTVVIKMDIVPLYRSPPSSASLSTKTSRFQFFFFFATKVQLQGTEYRRSAHLSVSPFTGSNVLCVRQKIVQGTEFFSSELFGWRHSSSNCSNSKRAKFRSEFFINRCCFHVFDETKNLWSKARERRSFSNIILLT